MINLNSMINIFSEEDVTVTMYTAAYSREAPKPSASSCSQSSKVDTVCDAVRKALENIDSDKWVPASI